MSKLLKIGMLVIVVLLIGGALLAGGMMIGRMFFSGNAYYPGAGFFGFRDNGLGMMFTGREMMGQFGVGRYERNFWQQSSATQFGRGMMNGYEGVQGGGIMGGYRGSSSRGMMGAYRGSDRGMMGNYGTTTTGSSNATPLSIEDSKLAIEKYLSVVNNPDLVLKEVMVFYNNSYGLVIEKSTGVGAMELLVDSQTKSVTLEPGPNHMWNLKYGMMSGVGQGSCMEGKPGESTNNSAERKMTISSAEAVSLAQKFLDESMAGNKAASDPQQFYGYYTLDYEKDGKPAGMLSVNGFTGQIFLHTWHGTFVEEKNI